MATRRNGNGSAKSRRLNGKKSAPRSGRNGNGTFAKGNPGGPGRPTKAVEELGREAIREALTVEDLKAVWAVVKSKAIEGDLAAAKLIFEYTTPKPTQKSDITLSQKIPLEEYILGREDEG